jgi:hypothetical protein
MFTLILSLLLKHHGHSLERMDISCLGSMKQWVQAQYMGVLDQAPRLRYLRVVTKETDGSGRMLIDIEVNGL